MCHFLTWRDSLLTPRWIQSLCIHLSADITSNNAHLCQLFCWVLMVLSANHLWSLARIKCKTVFCVWKTSDLATVLFSYNCSAEMYGSGGSQLLQKVVITEWPLVKMLSKFWEINNWEKIGSAYSRSQFLAIHFPLLITSSQMLLVPQTWETGGPMVHCPPI